MADCVREQLLGYLLGALEESERAWLEEQLANDPELRKELALVRIELESLRPRRQQFDVPFGLATRTCECVFSHADGVGESDVPFDEGQTPIPPRV
jgi:anti-sigma-K factor RskA